MANNLISKYARLITERSKTDRIRCHTPCGALFYKYAVTLFPCNHKAYIAHGGTTSLTTTCNTCRELKIEYPGFAYDLTTPYRIHEVEAMIDEAEHALTHTHYMSGVKAIYYTERARGNATERLPRLRARLRFLKKLHEREQLTKKTRT